VPDRLEVPAGDMGGALPMTASRRQSRLMSFVEAVANVVVGYLLAIATQFAVFPLFGLAVSVGDNLVIGGIFTAVSLIRSFVLRRIFEAIRTSTGRR
jgi:hypothetical protein